MRVRNAGQKGKTSIGFTSEGFKLRRQPGWDSNSCGYHGDDGYLYRGNGKAESFGPKFTSGDIIGAGINYLSQRIFLHEKWISCWRLSKSIKGPLYPTIAVHSEGEEVTVNFGKEPFCFDIEGLEVLRALLQSKKRKAATLANTKNLKEFPEEVETPLDIPAKKRFAKYRGLKSFRTSSWNPKESLPPGYARIFVFDNFARTQKHVLAKVSS